MRAALYLAALLALPWLAGCSESPREAAPETTGPPTASAPRVLESFQVGPDVYVRSLAVDAAAGQLWVGTSLGAHQIDLRTNEPVNTFTRDNGLANEYVFAAFVDSGGAAWLGTNGGGVSRHLKGEWTTWFPMHGLADYWVYALAEAEPGTLWIGTWAGANRLDVATGRFETYYDELVNEWVYGVAVDSQGRVWFGTEGGVSMFDGEAWREWTHTDGLGAPNVASLPPSTNTGLGTRSRHDLSVMVEGGASYNPDYVFCIRVDRKDAVWAGTWGGGVSRFDGRNWHNLSTRDGLAGNIVFSIAEAPDGAMWFGTDQGLSRFDGRNWQTLGTDDGLPGTAVYALAVTPGGEVWAGTRGGVARIGY